MKHLLTLFFVAIWLVCAHAQPKAEDRFEAVRQLIRAEQFDGALAAAAVLINDPTFTPRQLAQAYYLRGYCLGEKMHPREALADFRTALTLYAHSDAPQKDSFFATLFFHFGESFGGLSEFDSCRIYLERSMEIRTRLWGADDPQVGFCLNSLGGLYAGHYRLGKSMEYRLRALSIFEKHRLPQYAFSVANNLAMLCKSLGDNGKALIFMEKAESFSQSPGVSTSYRAIMLSNYAVLLADAKKEHEANAAIASAWALQSEMRDSTIWLGISENHAELFRLLGRPVEAIPMDSARLYRLTQTRPDAQPLIAHIHAALANDFFLAGQPANSLQHWDAALAIYESIFPKKQPTLANAFREKALCHAALGDTAQAFLFLEKSLLANGFDTGNLSDIIHWEMGFKTFLERARVCFSTGDYKFALADIQRADTCVMLQRLQLRVSESKSRLSALSRPVYELGAEAASLLYAQSRNQRYFDLAFHFSEQSKSIELAEALRAFDAVPSGDSAALGLFEREEFYRAEITRLGDSLAAAKKPARDLFELEVFDMTIRYHMVLDTIRLKYEVYFNHKFGHQTISPERLTSWCAEQDRAVAAWFLTEKSILVFLFQKNERPELFRLQRDFSLESAIQQMTDGITAWFDDSLKTDSRFDAAYRNYLSAANLLYDKLLSPVKARLQGHRLVVIPDAALNYLSFDALLAEKPEDPYKFNKLNFAAETLNITYGFSATLLSGLSQNSARHQTLYPTLAFAPFAYPDGGTHPSPGDQCLNLNDPLPQSAAQSEIAVRSLHGAPPFLRTEARRDTFLRLAPKAGCLHIATHGCASTSDLEAVFLLFSGATRAAAPEPFTIADVCKLQLRAKLAVLSACLSGQGPIAPGEGMLGMARAFAYAGVQQVIMTQWKVGDTASDELMQRFYPYLAAGIPTDEALWQAKKEMFQQRRGFERLPYFWAGFVLIGTPE